MEEVINWIPDRRDDPIANEAADWMATPLTDSKVIGEWKLMSDGPPGKDSVIIKLTRNSDVKIRMEVASKIVELSEREPRKWPATLNEGVVVNIFKKGDRKTLGNQWNFPLAMASRVVARVLVIPE